MKIMSSNLEKKILIVDDESDIREIFRIALEKYKVFTAKDGKAAIGAYISNRPDLTLLDLRMPDMDGFETAKELIKIDPNAKIMLISAYNESKLSQQGIVGQECIVGYLKKPITIKKLRNSIEKIL